MIYGNSATKRSGHAWQGKVCEADGTILKNSARLLPRGVCMVGEHGVAVGEYGAAFLYFLTFERFWRETPHR